MAAPAKGTSRTAQNDVALIKKKGPGALATAYLVIYNVVMTAGWLVIAVGLVRAYLSKGSYHGLYYSIERPLKFFQTGALLEWKSGVVVHIGWTVSDDLLCIQEDGTVLIYDMFGNFHRHFSMGNEVLQNQVIEAKVFHSAYGTGVAIVTGAFRFTLAANIDDLKLRRLPEVPGLQVAPSCWAVLTQDRQTKVVLASGKDLYVLDNTACTPVTPPGIDPQVSSYFQMAASFSYKYLALFTDTGHVWMGTSNLKEKLSEFDTKVRSPPKQMVCQCRILKHNVTQGCLAGACEEIFKIASMAPGALLLEAHKEYEKESQKADEYLREIKEQNLLPEAVRQCVEAAGFEHEPETQKILLRADEYLREIKEQNLLPEAVRQCVEAAGFEHEPETQKILLRVREYKQMTVQVLIDRLVFRRLYPLAIEICRYLKIPEFQGVSRVLKHWACFKLLEFEPRSGEQVPLLLKMKRSQLALSKAIESGDTDLVYTVVTFLKNEMNRGDFFMTLRNQPVALGLYRQFCKHQEQNTLKDLFNQDDDHQELGNFYVRASYGEGSVEARMAALQNAVDEFNKAKNEFSARATEEQMKLLRWQRRFQEEFDKPYLDCSLHETVHSLLLDGKHKQAEQLYKDFRIPDKRFWWLKISALAEKEDWEELEKFSKSKKSPIGDLEQAVEAAIERSESELNLVLSRCTPTTDRALLDKINRARAGALKK
ncbi:UNVERIFIED_CONTAM: hypothetical protein FKN15_023298 [Acipenser sinensis]